MKTGAAVAHYAHLTEAERERLGILVEELGEALQAAGKILRHGYASDYPESDNRADLEREIGDVYNVMKLMCRAKDLDEANVCARQEEKQADRRYLHFQE